MPELLIFIVGFIAGGWVVFFFLRQESTRREAQARESSQQALLAQQAQQAQQLGALRESFESLSRQALHQNTEDFLKLAELLLSKKLSAGEQSLAGKKALIDQTLAAMRRELGQLQASLQGFEQERAQHYGSLAQQLRHTAEQTARLRETTDQLKGLLSNTKARGQWGERMAEDLFRRMGLQEGINYLKQQTGPQAQRPDFTFLLPKGQCVHMDVKFPLNNFLRYAEAEGEQERQAHTAAFLRDVRLRLREVSGRQYIDPASHTLDYVLLFIPSEPIYAFIMEQDPGLLDEALAQKAVLCSPISLYAILSVIRQAADNFSMETKAGEIRQQLLQFREQWGRYVQGMEKLGKKLDEAQREFQQLAGTRTQQLDKLMQRWEGEAEGSQ